MDSVPGVGEERPPRRRTRPGVGTLSLVPDLTRRIKIFERPLGVDDHLPTEYRKIRPSTVGMGLQPLTRGPVVGLVWDRDRSMVLNHSGFVVVFDLRLPCLPTTPRLLSLFSSVDWGLRTDDGTGKDR